MNTIITYNTHVIQEAYTLDLTSRLYFRSIFETKIAAMLWVDL